MATVTLEQKDSMATTLAKLAVYLEPELKDELSELAKIERRSLSQMAQVLIANGLEQAKAEGKIKQRSQS